MPRQSSGQWSVAGGQLPFLRVGKGSLLPHGLSGNQSSGSKLPILHSETNQFEFTLQLPLTPTTGLLTTDHWPMTTGHRPLLRIYPFQWPDIHVHFFCVMNERFFQRLWQTVGFQNIRVELY